MDLQDIEKADVIHEDGVWVGELPDLGDLRLKVRPLYGVQATRLNANLLRKIPQDRRIEGEISDEDMADIDVQVLSQVVLVGWENLTSGGKPVEYSVEKAREMLKSVVFSTGVRYAGIQANRQLSNLKETYGKNSQTPSRGKPVTARISKRSGKSANVAKSRSQPSTPIAP